MTNADFKFGLKTAFVYFPGTLSKVPACSFHCCRVAGGFWLFPARGGRTNSQRFPDGGYLPGCLFPNPLYDCIFTAEGLDGVPE